VVARRGRDYPSREPPARLAAALARSEEAPPLMPSAVPACAMLRALVVAAALLAGVLASAAPATAADPVAAVLDRTAKGQVEVPEATARAQGRLRRRLGARALLQSDPATGTPRIIARLDGFLTPPSRRDPVEIVLDYVRAHALAFGLDAGDVAGLRLAARDIGPDGTIHLKWEQRTGGLPSVDGGLHAAVTADGRLLNVRGSPLPDLDEDAEPPRISAAKAYATALPGRAMAPAAGAPQGAERTTSFAGGGRASLVRYRDDGVDRVGWRVLAPAGSAAFYDAIVDARTGTLKRRINRVRFASIRHFDLNPRAESGSWQISPEVPPIWLDAGPGLSGPYVHAISDLDDRISLAQTTPPFGLTANPQPSDEVQPTSGSGDDRVWEHPLNLGFCADFCSWSGSSASSRTANREFSTAQLFWYVNSFRDHLAAPPIGFVGDVALEGTADRVLAQSLDGARSTGTGFPDGDHLNNASMLTLPDGYGALLQVHLFAFGTSRYDGAHDAGLVYHEYSHGLIDRLVTDAQGFGAMNGAQPGALAEGISDFYALDFLVPAQVPDTEELGEIHFGKWLQFDPATKGLEGTLRSEGMDCPVGIAGPDDECPGTTSAGPGGYDYADFGRIDAAPEIHVDGEIWAQTLWSLRTQLIDDHDPTEGLKRVRTYVTEGLRLAPENPTFLDMRNAIVQAAVSAHGDEDWATLWDVFAARGMGWSASTEGPEDITPFAANDAPPAPGDASPRGAVDGTILDETGAPVPGVELSVAGHDTGLGATDLRAVTGDDGRYLMPGVPAARYVDFYARKPGFQESSTGLDVTAGATTTVDFLPLRRDYASTFSGGSVSSFTGPNFGGDGCGPGQVLDDDKHTVWSTAADEGPQDIVIDLGRRIDLREVRIDPRAGCGDPAEASLSRYELAVSDGLGQAFERIAGGIVGEADVRGYVSLPLAGDATGRRLLRLRAIEPRSLDQDGAGPYMDVAELEVTGTPVPASPLVVIAQPPPPAASPPVKTAVAVLKSRKLTAGRKGRFRVKVAFASAAPSGKARLTVLAKRKKLATKRFEVKPGRTVTVKLRLNRSGRKAIKPGRSRKVNVELRLPGGEKVKKSLKLMRKKR
jgi:extracellular elastinolytic metalloproteinase